MMITNGIAICTDEKFPLNEEKHVVHSLRPKRRVSKAPNRFYRNPREQNEEATIDRSTKPPPLSNPKKGGRSTRARDQKRGGSDRHFISFFFFFLLQNPK